jgi:hypothetical protein
VDRGVGDLGTGEAGVWEKQNGWPLHLWLGLPPDSTLIGNRFSLDTDLTTWLEWRGSSNEVAFEILLELLFTADFCCLQETECLPLQGSYVCFVRAYPTASEDTLWAPEVQRHALKRWSVLWFCLRPSQSESLKRSGR